MSGRTSSDPGGADAKATSSSARSTDSEIDAAFAAATSEKPPPAPLPPPRRPAETLVGIAPPVEDKAPAPVTPTPTGPRPVQAFDQEETPSDSGALTLRRGPPEPLPAKSSEKPSRSSEKPFHRPRRPPRVGRVMGLRVRFLGGSAPLWSVLTLLIVPIVGATALLTLAVHVRLRPVPAAAPQASVPATTASAASEPVASAAPVQSSGNQLGLNELEGKPPEALTSEQVLARATGRRERELSVAVGLRENLEREPDAIKQKAMLLALRKLTTNPGTAVEALGAMATLPGSLGPDLLYEVWIAAPARPEAELARELLYSSDLRPKASPALSVALDLRAIASCEQAKAALSRAIEAGDRRALSPMNKLRSKRGCGPAKKEDCYPCLREGDELKDATIAAKKRKAPSPFTVR